MTSPVVFYTLLFLNIVTGTMLFTPCATVSFSPPKRSTGVVARRGAVVGNEGTRPLMVLRGGASDESIEEPVPVPALQPEVQSSVVVESAATANVEVSPSETSSAATEPASVVVATGSARTPLLGPKAPSPGLIRRSLPNLPWHRLPNVLTYFRCLAIPLLVWMFYLPGRHVATASLFALASSTDFLDGYLARRWDITSSFGAFLDPVADKLMVSTALILLSGRFGAEVALPTAVILGREIAVSALREWMAQRGQRDAVQVGLQGKIKTALTMVALTVYLLIPADLTSGKQGRFHDVARLLLWLSAAITTTSGSVYFRAAAPVLLEHS